MSRCQSISWLARLIATSQCLIPCQPLWPASSVSSATKISSVAASITGVPVIPSGSMSPQPTVGAESTTDFGTVVPTCKCQITLPVRAAIAYTVSFSVATYTVLSYTSGSP